MQVDSKAIKEVVYLSDKYADTDETIASKKLLDSCNVQYRKIDLKDSKEFVIKL